MYNEKICRIYKQVLSTFYDRKNSSHGQGKDQEIWTEYVNELLKVVS